MKNKIIIEITSIIFFLLFMDVGLSKLLDNHSFKVQLDNSPLLKDYVNLIAIPVPLSEVLIAITLLVSKTRKFGLLSSLCLMIVFTAYNIYLLTYGGHLPCGCGGIFKHMSWPVHLWVNSTLTILGLIAVWLSFKTPSRKWEDNSKIKPSFT